jgi:ribosomal protein S18 acetylase RimI-like enzyme
MPGHLALLPFTTAHAATVAGWPASAEEVAMWCGRREFPLSARTVDAWQQDADVRALLLVLDGEPVGYGELWCEPDEDEVELARLIVAPDVRGRGLGRALTRALLAQALGTGRAEVFLRVHPANERALRCYRGAGFVPVDPALAASWNTAQPVPYAWLRYDAAADPPASVPPALSVPLPAPPPLPPSAPRPGDGL